MTAEKLSHRERREVQIEQLYEKIDKKVGIITDVRNFTREKSNLSPQEFIEICRQKLDSVKDSFDPATINKFEKLTELQKKLLSVKNQADQRYEEICAFYTTEKGESDEEKIFNASSGDEMLGELEGRTAQLKEEIDLFADDDDIRFLEQLDNFFQNIIRKRKEAHKAENNFKDNPKQFWNRFYNATGIDLRRVNTDDVQVIFSGLGINIILPKEKFTEVTGNKYRTGQYYPNTIYNLIRKHPKQEITIAHENAHNISESFVENPLYASKLIQVIEKRVQKINKMKEVGAPSIVTDEETIRLKYFIRSYIYQNFNEIIADIEQPPRENLRAFTICLIEAINKVEKFISEIKDPEHQRVLSESLNQLEDKSVQYIDKLSNILIAGEQLGDIEKIKSAIILHKPEDLRKVERYAEHQVGPENYELISLLRPFIQQDFSYFKVVEEVIRVLSKGYTSTLTRIIEGLSLKESLISFLSVEKVMKTNELIEKQKIAGKDKEVQKISQLILEEAFHKLSQMDLSLLFKRDRSLLDGENFIELINQLERLGNNLFRPEFKNFAEKILGADFLIAHYELALQTDDFENLKTIYGSWPWDSNRFKENLIAEIGTGNIFKNYSHYHGKKHTKRTIKQSKFWDFLREIGLNKKADNLLSSLPDDFPDIYFK